MWIVPGLYGNVNDDATDELLVRKLDLYWERAINDSCVVGIKVSVPYTLAHRGTFSILEDMLIISCMRGAAVALQQRRGNQRLVRCCKVRTHTRARAQSGPRCAMMTGIYHILEIMVVT